MFQRIATKLLGDLDFVKVYTDDAIMCPNAMVEHIAHTTVVCECISCAELRLMLRKCFFAKRERES